MSTINTCLVHTFEKKLELVINHSEVFQALLVFYLLRMPRRAGEAKVQATIWGDILLELRKNGRKVCTRDENE